MRLRLLSFCIVIGLIILFKPSDAISQINSNKNHQLPTASTGNSLLWEITGKNLNHISYLFGTIHIIDSAKFFWPQTFNSAFKMSDKLIMEVNLSNPMAQSLALMPKMVMDSGKTLADLYTKSQYDTIASRMQKMGFPIALFQKFKPLFVQQMLVLGDVKKGNFKSYEMFLSAKAKKAEKETDGLETIAEQLKIIDSIPIAKQAELLYNSVMQVEEEKASLNKLINFYTQQNLDSLNAMLNADNTLKAGKALLLKNRNLRWISEMAKLMDSASCFFAVGAGHLPGKVGVIALLKKAGYQLRPIASVKN